MRRKIKFTPTADRQYTALEKSPSKTALLEQVRKAIGYLEIDPHHPGLQTHEFTSLAGAIGEKVFEAYAQNNTPGAYRIFWRYGPDETAGKKRTPVITILARISHGQCFREAIEYVAGDLLGVGVNGLLGWVIFCPGMGCWSIAARFFGMAPPVR